jgi:hypothetical protein
LTSLPSLRALDLAQGARIWLAAEATDMRCGFGRLAERANRDLVLENCFGWKRPN